MTTGCRAFKESIKNDRQDPVVIVEESNDTESAEALEAVNNMQFHYYTANFSCTIRDIAVNGQIRMVHDSIIWISVNKFIEMGRAILTPTRVQGYVKLMNKYFDGSWDDLRQQLGLDIDFATVEAMLTGSSPVGYELSRKPEQNGNDVTLWFKHHKGQKELKLTKDYHSRLLTNTELSVTKLGELVQCNYKKRENVLGQEVPSEITVRLKCRRIEESTEIEIGRIVLGKRQEMPFSIPKHYDRL